MVQKEVPQAKLVIVGEGGLVPKLMKLTEELNLQGVLIFTGRISNEKLLAYYTMCDLFVFPSVYEPFGYVVMEAMSFGKPVIVSNIPGVGENVKEGLTGLKVPPANTSDLAHAIITLLKNDELRCALGRNAKREIAKRSWEDVAKETVKIYREAYASTHGES